VAVGFAWANCLGRLGGIGFEAEEVVGKFRVSALGVQTQPAELTALGEQLPRFLVRADSFYLPLRLLASCAPPRLPSLNSLLASCISSRGYQLLIVPRIVELAHRQL